MFPSTLDASVAHAHRTCEDDFLAHEIRHRHARRAIAPLVFWAGGIFSIVIGLALAALNPALALVAAPLLLATAAGGISALKRDRRLRFLHIAYEPTPEAGMATDSLGAALSTVSRQGLWQRLPDGSRRPVGVHPTNPPRVTVEASTWMLKTSSFVLYFLPDRLLLYRDRQVLCLSYGSLLIEAGEEKQIEYGHVPPGANVVTQVWEKANKDGSPDRRYKTNRQVPVCQYATLNLASAGGLQIQLRTNDADPLRAVHAAITAVTQIRSRSTPVENGINVSIWIPGAAPSKMTAVEPSPTPLAPARRAPVRIPSPQAGTPIAFTAAPQAPKVAHPAPPCLSSANRITALVKQNTSGGECLAPAGQLFGLMQPRAIEHCLRNSPPGRLSLAESRDLAAEIEGCGYAVEPDARIAARPYAWNETLAIFLLMEPTPVDPARYRAAACVAHLGIAIAQADGQITPDELKHLLEQVESIFSLPFHESRRLEACCDALSRTQVDLPRVLRSLERSLPQAARVSVGRLLVAIAAADGNIDRRELAVLRRCYRALDLAPGDLDAAVAEVLPDAGSGLVTVHQPAPVVPGDPIPQPRNDELRLNRAAISAIMAETREVAQLLADAMAANDDPAAAPSTPTPLAVVPPSQAAAAEQPNGSPPSIRSRDALLPEGTSPGNLLGVEASPQEPTTVTQASLPGCPARFAPLWEELRRRGSMPRNEAEALARAHGLMLSGALEAINDWAFQAFGAPIADDSGEGIVIDRSLL